MNQENKEVKSNEVCKLCLHQECVCKEEWKCNCGYGDTGYKNWKIFGHQKSCNVYVENTSQSLEEKEHKTEGKCCEKCNGTDIDRDGFGIDYGCLKNNCICHIPPIDSKLKDKQKEQLIKVAPAEYSNYNILNKKIKRSIALWIRRRNDTIDLDESLTKIIQNLIQSERKEVIGKHNAHILNEWQLKGLGDERVLFPILEKATEISLSSNKPSNE